MSTDIKWLCQCDCENKTEKYIFASQLNNGRSKDCGCERYLNKEKYVNNLIVSFYDWCINNNRHDLIKRWDYNLNKRDINKVGLNSKGKFWFKCPNNVEHHSDAYVLNTFIKYPNAILKCKQCNSFGQWCISNDRKDILDRWDYELNKYSPFEVTKTPKNKYYLKCPVGLHKSELKNIQSLTVGNVDEFKCNQCNSFGQFCIDNIDENFLEKYWDYEKNTKDPFHIARAYNGKVWIKCQEKKYHGSYKISCAKFTTENQRCSYCAKADGNIHKYDSLGYLRPEVFELWSDKNKKTPYEYSLGSGIKVWWKCSDKKHSDYQRVISRSVACDFECPNCLAENYCSYLQQKVSKYIHDEYPEYTLVHEYCCSIIPRNKESGFMLPFDNEIKELKLICEVHGEQHYNQNNSFHKMVAKRKSISYIDVFKQRLFIDEYKKQYALENGYEYLEIPYTSEKDHLYKQIIDNKIKEILRKINS